jgi:two-component system cell cycle response regulator
VRILIADDDVTSRVVLEGVLRKFGHEVVPTVDGVVALEVMQRPDAPRLAILDRMMPGMGGLDVCRAIRAVPSDQPPYIIILTAEGEKGHIVDGLEAGADDYLAKPFDAAELRARVGVGARLVELEARLAEVRAALAHEAMHDPLTGVLNRRAFAEALARELSEERRYGQGLAVGICDIDRFKAINDTYGHPLGDEVLAGFVQLVERNLRGHDVLGRHGGDEFIILATHISAATVPALFERIRAVVASTPIPTSAGEVPLTISIGVSVMGPGETEVGLLAAADTALYQAKAAGRDCVCLADQAAPVDGVGMVDAANPSQASAADPPDAANRAGASRLRGDGALGGDERSGPEARRA